MSDTADAGDVATGPNAVGVVSGVHPGQEHCYSVAFPKGVSVFLSDAELADTACYRVEPAEADFPDRPARWRSGALAMLLRHPDSGVRLIATEAFGEIHGPAPEQALVKALQDEDGEVRWTAADGLRSIGTLSALAALAAVAEGDPMPTVREVAALAMDGIDPGRRRTGMKSDLFGEVGCPRFARKMTQKKCREYLVTAGKRETVDRLERESAPLGEWREQVELAEDGEFLGMVAKAHLELLRRQNEKTMPSEPGQCHS
jgi:hypothetical protein